MHSPFQGHLCCYTFENKWRRKKERQEKKKQVAPGKTVNSCSCDFHCSISSPFLALWHMAGYVLKLAVQFDKDEMMIRAESSLNWLHPHNAKKELTRCLVFGGGGGGGASEGGRGSGECRVLFVSSNLRVTGEYVQSNRQRWRGGWRWEGGGWCPAWGTLSHSGCPQSCSGSPLGLTGSQEGWMETQTSEGTPTWV